MTADPPSADDTAVASSLAALDDIATPEHLAVYTAIAGDLAARLDQQDNEPGNAQDDQRENPPGGAHG